eukprot:scaffold2858_cov659-Pavlova_lutheri.AAC.15
MGVGWSNSRDRAKHTSSPNASEQVLSNFVSRVLNATLFHDLEEDMKIIHALQEDLQTNALNTKLPIELFKRCVELGSEQKSENPRAIDGDKPRGPESVIKCSHKP